MADVECTNCGAVNPADYTFCFHCRALPGVEAPVTADATPKAKRARSAPKKKTAAKKAASK